MLRVGCVLLMRLRSTMPRPCSRRVWQWVMDPRPCAHAGRPQQRRPARAINEPGHATKSHYHDPSPWEFVEQRQRDSLAFVSVPGKVVTDEIIVQKNPNDTHLASVLGMAHPGLEALATPGREDPWSSRRHKSGCFHRIFGGSVALGMEQWLFSYILDGGSFFSCVLFIPLCQFLLDRSSSRAPNL